MSAPPSHQDDSTSSHPDSSKPDPTTFTASSHAAQGGLAAPHAAGSTELASLKVELKNGLRQYPDFPTPGILFEDIMPLFASHNLFSGLVRALELQVADVFHTQLGVHSDVDVVVGLESRGFLFGPTLALRLGAGFVPVRKQGKLPGKVETETFKKEYGEDVFQMQSDAIKPGAKVVIVDDIIATGTFIQRSQRRRTKMLTYRFNRWQCCSSWKPRKETRRKPPWLYLHYGARLPQGPR